MTIVGVFVGILMKIVAIFKRMLCFLHIRRHRKNSGTILPLHVDTKTLGIGEIQTSLPTNDIELESWDSWGMEDRNDFSPYNKLQTNSIGMSGGGGGGSRFPNKKLQPDPEPEPEKDYFQELQLEPSISRTQKILIRKKEEQQQHNHSGLSSRLAMTSEIPILSSELGVLEDNESGWGEEVVEDLTNEAISAIKDKRRLERERKIAEHQQKKLQKESTRAGKKDGIAAKLS